MKKNNLSVSFTIKPYKRIKGGVKIQRPRNCCEIFFVTENGNRNRQEDSNYGW